MPIGFQSINDWGTVQIDEEYSSICLQSSSVITINGNMVDTTLDVYGKNPFLLFGSTNGAGIVVRSRVNISGSTWRYTLQANTSVNVRVYVFDNSVPFSGNSGMQVFNSSGVLIFDSNAPFLRLTSVLQLSGSGPQSFTVPNNGRTYVVALTYSRLSIEKRPVTHAPWDLYQEGLWYDGYNINIDRVKTDYVGGENPSSWIPNSSAAPPQILVVDITGY